MRKQKNNNQLVTVRQFADFLGISRQALHYYIKQHEIPADKIGHMFALSKESQFKVMQLRSKLKKFRGLQ